MKKTTLFNNIHKQLQPFFPESHETGGRTLHDLLWQIIVNEVYKDRMVAATPVIKEGRIQVVIVEWDKPGYIPVGIFFKDDDDYAYAGDILDLFNKKVFHLSIDTSLRIVSSSMKEKVLAPVQNIYEIIDPDGKVLALLEVMDPFHDEDAIDAYMESITKNLWATNEDPDIDILVATIESANRYAVQRIFTKEVRI